jgi:hypothetical protein
MHKTTVEKTIFFFEITALWHDDYVLDGRFDTPFQQLLSKITKLAANKEIERYLASGEKELFINEQRFKPDANKHIVEGKLLAVRKDFFPEIMNTKTDDIRDIEALEAEGIVETTHFVVQERKNNKTNKIKIAIEHNQFGAKANDLLFYLETIGKKHKILRQLEILPLVTNNLEELENRMGQISQINMKVHKNSIPYLKNADNDLFGSMDAIADHYQQDYVTLVLKYDLKTKNQNIPGLKRAKELVSRIFRFLGRKKDAIDHFEQLDIRAEDSTRRGALNIFDLLSNRIKSNVRVERKIPAKTIISLDMFEKIKQSWQNLGIRL